MASISVNLSNDVYFKVVKESNEKGVSISKVITHHLREYYKAKEIKIIKCDKCGAEYSSALGQCPSCRDKQIEQQIAKYEHATPK